ncbi:hypothetical protein PLICRDRAFT_174847 [Plicaturopsis crispa FD-325 SS-3]|nr:hypothetical protein PLICRDRAFT_174847 [Plicaturopsis crispa FD-325 SS-3]
MQSIVVSEQISTEQRGSPVVVRLIASTPVRAPVHVATPARASTPTPEFMLTRNATSARASRPFTDPRPLAHPHRLTPPAHSLVHAIRSIHASPLAGIHAPRAVQGPVMSFGQTRDYPVVSVQLLSDRRRAGRPWPAAAVCEGSIGLGLWLHEV